MDKLSCGCWAISWCENHFNFTSLLYNIVLATILISISMSTNDDRLSPSWDKSWDIINNNCFTENGSIKNVSNRSVRWFPHLLKFEFLNTTFIRRNCSALNTNFVLKHCFRAVNGNLIVCRITILDWQVVVFGFKVKIGLNVLYKLMIIKLPFPWSTSKWLWSFHLHQHLQ